MPNRPTIRKVQSLALWGVIAVSSLVAIAWEPKAALVPLVIAVWTCYHMLYPQHFGFKSKPIVEGQRPEPVAAVD